MKTKDGATQKLTDKIQVITEDQVTSEIIKSGVGKDSYFQYYLNAKSKSVTKQIYKKEGEFYKLAGPIRQTYCIDVRADWKKSKIEDTEVSKDQEQILKTQERL